MENNELMMEGTTPTEEAETEPVATEEPETAPQESEEPTAEGEENNTAEDGTEVTTEVEETFSLQVNHEEFKVSRGDAIRLAQIGKNYEDRVKPMLDDLEYFATLQGKSVKELIKGLVDGVEISYRQELTEQLGADNPLIEEMLELHRTKNRKNYEDLKADREAKEKAAEEEAQKSLSTKLAEQYENIRDLFPEYDAIEKIPDSVLKLAMKSGDLEKELLRFEKSERAKIEAANASKEKNINQNVGSMSSSSTEDGSTSAFMKGLWG